MSKKIMWVLVAFVLFIVAVNLMAREYVADVKKEPLIVPKNLQDIPRSGVSSAPEASFQGHEGVVVVRKFDKPVTQDEWDKYMHKLIVENKVLDTDEGARAMQKMAINQKQYTETMARLDQETKKVEQLYAQAPGDPFIQQRMDNLRKARALTKVLVERGVVADEVSDLPGMTTPRDPAVFAR
jgi:cell fate (sporulation/competence/biofilm development) regulator YmcA (YheA/YmcA/DUF963 family)